MRKGIALFVAFICITWGFSQVSSVTFNKQKFFEPTIESMGYLLSNPDSVTWNKALLPMGIPLMPLNMRTNELEYKKKVDGFSQYIGYDDRFGVLTIVWKDESGKNSFATSLRKKLKKKEYNAPGIYRTEYGGHYVIISIESNKDKGINEMITMEIERQ